MITQCIWTNVNWTKTFIPIKNKEIFKKIFLKRGPRICQSIYVFDNNCTTTKGSGLEGGWGAEGGLGDAVNYTFHVSTKAFSMTEN